jgi:hypothetical protein
MMHMAGENVKYTVTKNKLTIEIDLDKELGNTSSGKSMLVASTHGAETPQGTDVSVNLNVYRKIPKDKQTKPSK